MSKKRMQTTEIKLLRLELVAHGKTPCDEIGFEWCPAQPTENLSPEKAAALLGVDIWAPQSAVRSRYRTLQMRFPPEQFPQKHITLRPAFELLSQPAARLNWYWQSGLTPEPHSDEESLTSAVVLNRI